MPKLGRVRACPVFFIGFDDMTHDGAGLSPKQEKILTALLSTPSLEAAASVVGCTRQTLYRHMADPQFDKAYREARARLLDGALCQLEASAGLAIETLREIMQDQSAQAAARVGAARAVLESLLRVRETVQIEERLAELERRADAQTKNGRAYL